jgi:hypothetical protein
MAAPFPHRVVNGWTGPICRTVQDAARILDASERNDRNRRNPLKGYRIGVTREYMDKDLFTVQDFETIDIIDDAIDDLRDLGATIVDPGPGGALFQSCVDRLTPVWLNQQFVRGFPDEFPFDEDGEPLNDHVSKLVDRDLDPSLVPKTATGRPGIRNFGGDGDGDDVGDTRYNFEVCIRERGDATIQSLTDLFRDRRGLRGNDPAPHAAARLRSDHRGRSRARPTLVVGQRALEEPPLALSAEPVESPRRSEGVGSSGAGAAS